MGGLVAYVWLSNRLPIRAAFVVAAIYLIGLWIAPLAAVWLEATWPVIVAAQQHPQAYWLSSLACLLKRADEVSEHYWFSMVHLAGLGVPVCLAYLVYGVFRHTRLLSEHISIVFGETEDEKRSNIVMVREMRDGASPADRANYKDLFAVYVAWRLAVAQDSWLTETDPSGPRDPENPTLEEARAEATQEPWFSGEGRLFQSPFHTGADIFICSLALILCIFVHVMAGIEDICRPPMLAIFAGPIFRASELTLILWLSVVMPIWQFGRSFSLTERIRAIIGRAEPQMKVLHESVTKERSVQIMKQAVANAERAQAEAPFAVGVVLPPGHWTPLPLPRSRGVPRPVAGHWRIPPERVF